MEAKKCDRCKKYYTPESEKSKNSFCVLYPFKSFVDRPYVYEEVLMKGDLCAECTKDFMRWFKNEDNGQNI